jgi:quinol monooxygenase YgiN
VGSDTDFGGLYRPEDTGAVREVSSDSAFRDIGSDTGYGFYRTDTDLRPVVTNGADGPHNEPVPGIIETGDILPVSFDVFTPAAHRPDGPADEETARLYGQIAIYTLIDGQADEFDQLAQAVVEKVKALEPDTLAYIVHGVPSAPMQRILYEVYRDEAAFTEHGHQPYIQDFEEDRKPYVLATNVIELGVRQAKLSPLGGQPGSTPAPPAGAARPGPPAWRGGPGPEARPSGPTPPAPPGPSGPPSESASRGRPGPSGSPGEPGPRGRPGPQGARLTWVPAVAVPARRARGMTWFPVAVPARRAPRLTWVPAAAVPARRAPGMTWAPAAVPARQTRGMTWVPVGVPAGKAPRVTRAPVAVLAHLAHLARRGSALVAGPSLPVSRAAVAVLARLAHPVRLPPAAGPGPMTSRSRGTASPHSAGAVVPGDRPASRHHLAQPAGCHLCDDAREVIARVAAEFDVPWEELDITTSDSHLRQYWDQIPVTLIDGVQHDFWHVSEERLRAALTR